uniref:Uncharacterized protein n=1 Tax=Rangifer tarandus platyrhynchus TaxID=3082113 RepID=A0ACB0FLB1_RANTA|nr:unnamed protein product [Rangifer tarandus platyrhynchus]
MPPGLLLGGFGHGQRERAPRGSGGESLWAPKALKSVSRVAGSPREASDLLTKLLNRDLAYPSVGSARRGRGSPGEGARLT